MKEYAFFEAARSWMYRYARPLELALWEFHFEGGKKEPVLKALAGFQNKDGGFGNGLECDNRNPNSNPIAVWKAASVLSEIHFYDSAHPVVEGMLSYLKSGADFINNRWLNTVESNNTFPTAPWWKYQEGVCQTGYNPTASLAGFVLLHAPKESPLFGFSKQLVKEACQSLLHGAEEDEHAIAVFFELLDFVSRAGLKDLVPYEEAQLKLEQNATAILRRDAGQWGTYTCRPSRFIHTPKDGLYPYFSGLVEQEVQYLLRTQKEDGSWPVNWTWGGLYPDVWPVAEQENKGAILLENCRFIKQFLKVK